MPGFKAWTTEDGRVFGPMGPKKTAVQKLHRMVSVVTESGQHTTTTVMRLMSLTWMPPQPPGTVLVHVNGDRMDDRASNLAWKPVDTQKQMHDRWARKLLAQMRADPNHPKHGTSTGYEAGCRCDPCRRAARISNAAVAVRRTLREMGLDPWERPS